MKKSFILILSFVVLLSYGQLLRMYVWQDDNGLFFKLAHISEKAGYLAQGPFGVGAYKYIATPYIPIYQIFKYNTVAYFALAIICYFITSIVIYFVSSKIFGEKIGRISGFLWASGYIASDGFIRLFNTVITSISVILISFLTFFYWKYFKERKIKWYLFSIISYFLAVEFAISRTHYLISVVIAFELFFLAFKKPILRSIAESFLRLIPFIFIFYRYFIVNADSRSANVISFLSAVLKGKFYITYGFFASVSNTIIPDWLTSYVFHFRTIYIWIISIIVFISLLFMMFKRQETKKPILIISLIIFLLWTLISRYIFISPVLNLGAVQIFSVFVGGSIIILVTAYYFAIQKESKSLYLFFIFWFFINIIAYSAYNPTFAYETINRYLAHSFFALVILAAIIYKANPKEKIVKTSIILFGLVNIISSIVYQNNVVKNRSIPPRNFYNELEAYVSKIEKGDVFYFDVAPNSRSFFADAFSVASMPETTAIAWRYGIDRYDLEMFTDFSKFEGDLISKKIPADKIHTFFYSDKNLIDTSEEMRNFLYKGKSLSEIDFDENDREELMIKEPIKSVAPVEITFDLKAIPIFKAPGQKSQTLDKNFVNKTFEYLKFKENILQNAKYFATSQWQDRVIENIHDQDTETLWQPNRILWHDKKESFTIDMKNIYEINRFVWINGFGNNTPTKYVIRTSMDGVNWTEVKTINNITRIDNPSPQIVDFNSIKARFVQMVLQESLNNDAPGISEAWVVPTSLSSLDIQKSELFLSSPFTQVTNLNDFNNLLTLLKNTGKVQIYWLNENGWETVTKSKINVIYDGNLHTYKVTIPAGALTIKEVKFSDFLIPGNLALRRIEIYYPPIF